MPASSSSWTSCQRFRWREPGTFEWASSSTSTSCGRRASAASRSNSASSRPRCETASGGSSVEALEQRGGLAAPMGLDDADQHVHALVGARAGGLQHRVGLADAGRGAEEDLQPAALLPLLLALDLVEKLVGIGTVHADWRAPVAREALHCRAKSPEKQKAARECRAANEVRAGQVSARTSSRRAPGSAPARSRAARRAGRTGGPWCWRRPVGAPRRPAGRARERRARPGRPRRPG